MSMKVTTRRQQPGLSNSGTVSFKKVMIDKGDLDMFSRHSRYFNINWFRFNDSMARYMMQFGNSVMELLDPLKYRISVRATGNRYAFSFWNLVDSKIDHKAAHKVVQVNRKGNVLNITKKYAIRSAYTYAVAIKLGFLDMPRKWKTIMKLPIEGVTASWKMHEENNNLVIEFRDKYYNKVKVPMEIITNHLYHFSKIYNKYQHRRKLKQYKNNKRAWLAFLKKSIKTDMKGAEIKTDSKRP